MWIKLKSVYDKESVVSIHLLQQKFFTLEFRESVSTYISQLEEIRNKLKQAGEELSEKMIMTKIIMSLPEQYKHFRSAWESVTIENQTLEELTARLLIEEERMKSLEGASALASTSNRRDFKHKRDEKASKQIKCFVCQKSRHIAKYCFKNEDSKTNVKKCQVCKKAGHTSENCWFRKNKESEMDKDTKADKKSEVNAFIGASTSLNSNDWCLDSGASEHMCNDKNLFETLKEEQAAGKIKIGDGTLLDVEGTGTVKLYAWNGSEFIKTCNGAYAPLITNIYSNTLMLLFLSPFPPTLLLALIHSLTVSLTRIHSLAVSLARAYSLAVSLARIHSLAVSFARIHSLAVSLAHIHSLAASFLCIRLNRAAHLERVLWNAIGRVYKPSRHTGTKSRPAILPNAPMRSLSRGISWIRYQSESRCLSIQPGVSGFLTEVSLDLAGCLRLPDRGASRTRYRGVSRISRVSPAS